MGDERAFTAASSSNNHSGPARSMDRVYFFLSQLIAGPVALLTGPFRFLNDVYFGSGRGRTFLMALPALFFAFLFGAVLLASQLGRDQRLAQLYERLATETNERAAALAPEFRKALRLYELELTKQKRVHRASANPAAGQAENPAPDGSGSPELQSSADADSPAKQKFLELSEKLRVIHSEERLYLRKLMDLKPDDESYQYRYAMTHFPEDEDVAHRLLVAMAPIDNGQGISSGVGYPDAHLRMADYYIQRPKASQRDQQFDLMQVEKHASQVLVRDPRNWNAREIRGKVLAMRREYARAYDDYLVLFEEFPKYFVQLQELNRLMKREQRDAQILENAARRLSSELAQSRNDLVRWEQTWDFYALCMLKRKRFEQLRQELVNEERSFADDDSKRQFLNNILEQASRERISQLLPTVASNPVDAEEAVSIVENAAKSGISSDGFEFCCAVLSKALPAFRPRINAVYDYQKDPDPSGLILIELASDALMEQRYQVAIEMLEKARLVLPDSPQVLNNLAFAYLSAENANPIRALELVDRALRALASSGAEAQLEMSSFLHTRGLALMQLGRVDEASVALLKALEARPNHEGTLELLIQCFDGRDELQKDVYVKRLDAIRKAPAPSPQSPPPAESPPENPGG